MCLACQHGVVSATACSCSCHLAAACHHGLGHVLLFYFMSARSPCHEHLGQHALRAYQHARACQHGPRHVSTRCQHALSHAHTLAVSVWLARPCQHSGASQHALGRGGMGACQHGCDHVDTPPMFHHGRGHATTAGVSTRRKGINT